jgi:hypothetical protein
LALGAAVGAGRWCSGARVAGGGEEVDALLDGVLYGLDDGLD